MNDPRIQRETSLRRAVLRGDDGAWRVLYDAAFLPLYRFVHRRTGHDETRTEEVLQECWMVAVRRMRSFDPAAAPFEAWLKGIARNVLRGAARRRARDLPAAEVDPDSQPAAAPTLASDQVALALTALPDRYQAVLRARYTERRSIAEIATATAQTVKAIESLLGRARAAFREAYARLEGSGREGMDRP